MKKTHLVKDYDPKYTKKKKTSIIGKQTNRLKNGQKM